MNARTIVIVTRRIAIATCAHLCVNGLYGDSDDHLLASELAELGVQANVVAWTEPSIDWSAFDASIIRSTWDYTAHRAEFLSWAATVPRLHNPASVISANSDKRYLATLAAAGVATVPTTFVEPGGSLDLPESGEFVLKPSVGAGSRGAARFDAARPDTVELARAHARALHEAGRTVMVQPYFTDVDTAGETALIFFDGKYSHAIAKAAMLDPDSRFAVDQPALFVPEKITARQPSAAEIVLAEQALATLSDGLSEPLLYSRIDLLPGPGGPVVIEAELTEPSLFLSFADGAAARLARAITDRI